MVDKRGAYEFLRGLSDYLNQRLPRPDVMRAEINGRWAKPAHERPPQDQLACKENLFLYHFALPLIFEYVQHSSGLSETDVVRSLRGEYYGKFPRLLSSNAHRSRGHPFSKNIKESPAKIMAKWKEARTQPLNQSFPDLCISAPFPYRVVCDAKFCDKSTLASAEDDLVTGVYEATFYLGLPKGPPDAPSRSTWDYEFGCLLAYDASPGSLLLQAWEAVASKGLFWEDANVFVMIVRGQD